MSHIDSKDGKQAPINSGGGTVTHLSSKIFPPPQPLSDWDMEIEVKEGLLKKAFRVDSTPKLTLENKEMEDNKA